MDEDEIYDLLLAEVRRGCYCERMSKPCEIHGWFADGVEAALRAVADAT